jgi:uncharacterized protein YggU (UPF0235/DUF167 family)
MKIIVKVKPFSKEEKVEKIPQEGFSFTETMDSYKVWTKEIPEDGKANEAVIKLLAEYFDVSKSEVILLKGSTSGQKIIEIL